LIDRTPITPLDPIAYRAAVARSGGQGRRPVFRRTDMPCDEARLENVSRRRSLALGRCEHDGRLMGNRDGELYAAVPAIMALLIAGTMIVTLPGAAMADPLANETQTTRTATAVASSVPWADHITEAAKRFAIPERWIRAVMRAESDYELRTRHDLGDNPYDPRDNILAGTAYIAELHDLYGSPGFLAAYNAGPGRYEKHLVTGDLLPAETLAYMAKIVPQIDAGAAVAYRTADRQARSEWFVAPLFVVRVAVPAGDGRTTDRSKITDLSALAPPSDGLFLHRSGKQEVRP
jgi:soluble lytic murein transglycosylase-like protein